MSGHLRRCSAWLLTLIVGGGLGPLTARAQDMAAPAAAGAGEGINASAGDEGPSTSDSTVGYIDPAIPMNVVRFRYDTAYHNNRPTRAEFYYARQGPEGRGLPLPETNVDFQDLSLYLEHTIGQRFSAFVEVPVRFANYAVNQDHSGLSDVTAGFKYAFLKRDDTIASFQFRAFAPTGNVHEGLGTGHASLEPAFLLFHRFTEKLASENELRLWVPVGGEGGFAGEVLRYGTGLHYDVYEGEAVTVAPVIEAVGWTFLNGKSEPVLPSGFEGPEQSASGTTVLNLKMGLRFRINDFGDLYAGYGRALTGAVLYKDIYRVEFRLFY